VIDEMTGRAIVPDPIFEALAGDGQSSWSSTTDVKRHFGAHLFKEPEASWRAANGTWIDNDGLLVYHKVGPLAVLYSTDM
jgi:hypothetical protein